MPRTTSAPPATACPELPLHFEALGRRQVVADFSGGHLSTDGGALLLRSVDRGLGLTVRLAQAFTESAALAFLFSAAASLCMWLLAVGQLVVLV